MSQADSCLRSQRGTDNLLCHAWTWEEDARLTLLHKLCVREARACSACCWRAAKCTTVVSLQFASQVLSANAMMLASLHYHGAW